VLSWEPPTNTGGTDITGYVIEKRDAKRNTWATGQNVNGQTTTFAVEKLLEGNEYYFRVSAQNDIGTSEPAVLDEATIAKSPYGTYIVFISYFIIHQPWTPDVIFIDTHTMFYKISVEFCIK